jgi:predicted Zn-dependent protease with MMP-like domain
VNRNEFERIVDEALDEIPQEILDKVDNLVILVEDAPTPEQDPTGELLGLYEGVALSERGDYWGALPDQITIFRKPHLAMGLSRTELRAEIKRTVLHEMAHHLGIDDDRLRELGWD